MKKILNFIIVGFLLTGTSCKKYLDVNENPNNLLDASPDLILPAALAQTAATTVTFNSYGAWVGGYQANAGGYGGFGSVLTYNYSTSDNTNLWSQSFNNINDYQTIINKTTPDGAYKNYNAIAKIMKAYCYLRLIDLYGDVPYSDALRGLDNLVPKYDKAEDVYRGLFAEINEAIASLALPNDSRVTISTNTSPNSTKIDILGFESGSYPGPKWTEFANTLKLKMLVRTREVTSFASAFQEEKAKLQSAAFVTYDVSAQPGYAAQADKQNPAWNTYAYTATGGNAQMTTIPAFYAVGFYNGVKLEDEVRGTGVTYRNYTTANQLGNQSSLVPRSPGGTVWFTGTGSGTAGSGIGVLKGPSMAQPLMLAAESYFLQAEANLFGIVPGDAKTNFNKGIKASQHYLYLDQNGTIDPDYDEQFYFEYYLGENPGEYLVDYDLAIDPDQQLEAIITQKWIAVNYIHSNEGFSDYRRTNYPRVTPGDRYSTPASIQSVSTRTDKLPVRVLYPATEYSLNADNVPKDINPFTSRIFYDLD